MKHGILKTVWSYQYHWALYHLHAKVSQWCAGFYIVNHAQGNERVAEMSADMQRKSAMKAHLHRLRAEGLFK